MYDLLVIFITGLVLGSTLTIVLAGYFRKRSCPYAGLIEKERMIASDSIHPTEPPIRP